MEESSHPQNIVYCQTKYLRKRRKEMLNAVYILKIGLDFVEGNKTSTVAFLTLHD